MVTYSTKTKNKTKNSGYKKWLIVLAVLVIFIGGGLYWRLRVYKPASQVITTAGSIPKSPTTSSSSTTSPPPKKQPTSNTGRTIGGGTDTQGSSTATTNKSQWITSKSGTITVEQPIANATLHSGDILSGTAKVDTVNFRLIDDSVGVIADGTLQVVDGKFSGKLGFTPHASTGRLDIFSTDSQGVEQNEIEIGVKY